LQLQHYQLIKNAESGKKNEALLRSKRCLDKISVKKERQVLSYPGLESEPGIA
jgi:hypothetical protein